MNKVLLVTFGDGHPLWLRATKRLQKQVKNFSLINDANIFNYKKLDVSFKQKHQNFIKHNPRGFGYWIWKPQILIQSFLQNEVYDFYFYLDAGSELYSSPKSLKKFETFLNMASEKSIFAFDSGFIESTYTKADLLSLFSKKHSKSNQFMASSIIFHKEVLLDFCSEWLKFMEKDNYHFLNDSQSEISNFSDFKEHRHDQSIFSLLAKDMGTQLYPDCSSNEAIVQLLNHEPIWNIRNKSSTELVHNPEWNRSPKKLDRLILSLHNRGF